MAIVRMISRDLEEFRRFQADMVPLGKIRTGVYATPAGKRGRPEKLDRFRFTSPHRDLIEAVAAEYGGEARPWSPDKDPNRKEFEVITDADELDVLIVNGQKIDPTYEAWAAGRTCVRRCDGVWDQITQDNCLCNGPNKPSDPQKLCKITTRVKVMLRRVPGVGSWLYESHGEYFAIETGGLTAAMVAQATDPVRSLLRLELERRREPDREKGGFKTKEFYVARFYTTSATPQQAISGGDMLTQALTGAPVREIASSPAPVTPTVPAPFDIEAHRSIILADIEAQTTIEGLDAIRTKLKAKGVDDQRVIDAWLSKQAGIQAAGDLFAAQQEAMLDPDPPRPYRVLVTGSRTWTDVEELNKQLSLANMVHRGRMVLVHGACPQGADALADTWAEVNGVPVERYPADWDGEGKRAGFVRNLRMVDSLPDIVLSFNRGESKGAEHCTKAAEEAGLKVLRFVDDTPVEVPESKRYAPLPGSTIADDREVLNASRADIGLEPLPPVDTFQIVDTERERHGGVLPGEPAYQVGDTVTVGGIEFTKISDNPFPPGSDAAKVFTLGKAPCLDPYCAGTDAPCGFTPQQHMEAHGVEAIIEADRAAGLIPGNPVDGVVEDVPGAVTLPDVPGDDHDAGELYTMIMTGASQQKPPLTTTEVNGLIVRTFGLSSPQGASGYQLARLRAGLKAGTVAWR